MTLAILLESHGGIFQQGDSSVVISGLALDSRQVRPGYAFIALKGSQSDGHQFIGDAIAAGATAVFCEHEQDELHNEVVYWINSDLRKLVGQFAADFFGNPTRKLTVVGVTGTNGKSSIVSILFDLYQGLGHRCGMLSTIENRVDQQVLPSTLTTPDAIEVHRLMHVMAEQGVSICFMEVSSHALDQGRVNGVEFDVAVFSNLSRDHLNYHGSFANYLQAKKSLFDGLKESAYAVTNRDDKNGMVMVQNTDASVLTCALRSAADYTAKVLEINPSGLQVQLDGQLVYSPLLGRFNAYNLLLAYTVAAALGDAGVEAIRILSAIRAPRGRFEAIHDEKRGVTFVVDYAHTPDALKNVLETLVAIRGKSGKIISVVGCGGDRDRGKRPIMARLACTHSDIAIFTSDNPRSEDPELILDDMMEGVDDHARAKVLSITSRREAIRTAAMMASRDSLVLVAGKGHEGYQEIAGERRPFQDQDVVLEIIKQV